MKEIIIENQWQIDGIDVVKADERLVIKASVKLTKNIELIGDLVVLVGLGESIYSFLTNNSSSPRIESWGSSSPRIESYGSSSPSIVSYGSSVIQATLAKNLSSAELHGYSVLSIDAGLKTKIKKSKTSIVQRVKLVNDWFERNGIKKQAEIVVFKRVSCDFKTQEGTAKETSYSPGTTVGPHPNWDPEKNECGEDKYHACSRPFFCDEFRSGSDDLYVAISVKRADLFPWPTNPRYPHKIAFRKGRVLYECDRMGNEINPDMTAERR